MTILARSSAMRAAGAASVAVALTWLLGGQMVLGRIDPALALPLLPLSMLGHAWLQRRERVAVRVSAVALAVLLLVAVEAALAFMLAGRIFWVQVGLLVLAASIAAILADRLIGWRTGRGIQLAVALFVVAGWFVSGHALLAQLYRAPALSAAAAPVTMVTGLPLRWSSGGDIAAMIAEGTGDDPALARIEESGPVRLVDSVVDSVPPPGGRLLLVHPRALAPQELVAIDAFVRGGGGAVILADALSGWPGHYPLGDPRNPPLTSLLTPLLDHWGITLGAAPTGETQASAVDVDGARLRLFSAGRFDKLPPTCTALADRRIAKCRIGRGMVWLVGDADLLYAPLWQPALPWAAHLRRADTMEWLAARLWAGSPRAALQPQWIRS